MVVTGIIAEYNPFHNGHLYHLTEARRRTGADYIIVVMSGDFVQRGEPAILLKEERTSMALNAGADIVLELPICFSTASAELFAKGGVSLLHDLGCVDFLCFGSESDNLEGLKQTASMLVKETFSFSESLKKNLKNGLPYALAMEQALSCEENSFLSTPNNLLGIEYIKSLIRLNSSIQPILIKREGAAYRDNMLCETSFSSASAIRKEIISNGVTDKLVKEVPNFVFNQFQNQYKRSFPIVSNDFSSQLNYARLMYGIYDTQSYRDYSDISRELSDRMEKKRFYGASFEEMIMSLKTKQYTYARISRSLLHLLLGITEKQLLEWNVMPAKEEFHHKYARILGFKKSATPLLSQIKKQGNITLITKASDMKELKENSMLQLDIRSSHLYHMAVYEKFGVQIADEYRRGVIVS